MTRERLVFKGVSEILGTDDIGLLVLTDELKERQITIVCDRAMAVQIELRLKMIPISNIMLPEVMCNLLKTYTDLNLEIVIEDIIDGQYRTLLYNADTLEPMLIRASDAVLLSIIGEIPIYIDSKLMKRQSTEYRENASGVTLPVNSISDEMLQSALERAIAEENYELASHLRDEQKRREHNGESKTSTK